MSSPDFFPVVQRDLLLATAKSGDSLALKNLCLVSKAGMRECKSLMRGAVRQLIQEDNYKLLVDSVKHGVLPFIKLFEREGSNL